MRIMVAAAILGVSIAGALAQEAVLPRAAIEADFKRLDCFVEVDDALREQDVFDLGAGKKLVLVLCLRGAYQGSSLAYVVEGAAPPRLLTFTRWDGKRFTPSEYVTEAEFDPATKQMDSFAKGRGIGDCGSMGSWQWTGAEFKLTEYFYKEKCNGQPFAGGKRWQVFPKRK